MTGGLLGRWRREHGVPSRRQRSGVGLQMVWLNSEMR